MKNNKTNRNTYVNLISLQCIWFISQNYFPKKTKDNYEVACNNFEFT